MTETETAGTGAGGGFDLKLPKTTLGKWSMWLAVAFVIGFIINTGLVGVFGRTSDTQLNEFSRTYLPYWGVALMSVGFISGIVGAVAVFKQKERSILTLLTIIPTLFVTIFLIGEFAIPH